jgi:nucleoside-diphosphate-sugar epimerase
LIAKARSGGELNMSPGEQVVDLTDVGDVVGAFAIAADRMLGAARPLWENHFVSGERCTVRELVAHVSELVGPVEARFGAVPYRPREVMMPVSAPPGRLLPGWVRKISLRETLRDEASSPQTPPDASTLDAPDGAPRAKRSQGR